MRAWRPRRAWFQGAVRCYRCGSSTEKLKPQSSQRRHSRPATLPATVVFALLQFGHLGPASSADSP